MNDSITLPGPDMRAAWDEASADYQDRHRIPTHSAHYGPFAPGENELRLLGDVNGRRILEVGCGGGQCAIAFAKQGATVAGQDLSEVQLAFARTLAENEGVSVEFVQGGTEDLSAFEGESWDVVFSAYVFQYVADMARTLAECYRVLIPGGRLVFSLDHPFRDCFWDEEDDEHVLFPARSYFDHPAHGLAVWRSHGRAHALVPPHHRRLDRPIARGWFPPDPPAGTRLICQPGRRPLGHGLRHRNRHEGAADDHFCGGKMKMSSIVYRVSRGIEHAESCRKS